MKHATHYDVIQSLRADRYRKPQPISLRIFRAIAVTVFTGSILGIAAIALIALRSDVQTFANHLIQSIGK